MNGNLLLEFRNMRREEEEKILLLFFLKCWSTGNRRQEPALCSIFLPGVAAL